MADPGSPPPMDPRPLLLGPIINIRQICSTVTPIVSSQNRINTNVKIYPDMRQNDSICKQPVKRSRSLVESATECGKESHMKQEYAGET
jgi:hypothetical protein